MDQNVKMSATSKLVGLLNHGNTCYVNTLLQCLYHCKYLKKFLQKTRMDDASDLYSSLKTLFNNMDDIEANVISPRNFLAVANKHLGKFIYINEQNDITEFYSLFIDKLNASISHEAPEMSQLEFLDKMSYDLKTSYDKLRFKLDYKWYCSLRKEMSKLCSFIYGQTITQIECGHCGKTHHNEELFTSLALPIPDGARSLYDCFDKHFETHIINSNHNTTDDKWTCDKCKKATKSEQVSMIWKAPPVLVLSLKRFNFTPQPVKNNSSIQVDSLLDLDKHILNKDNSMKYKLRGVALHYGSFFGGHYVALVNQKEKWFFIDDDSVRGIESPQDLISSKGYMFFYERV